MKMLQVVIVIIILIFCSSTQAKSFQANWDSLSQNPLPEWVKDAKFGVYTHWGVFSVPAHGGPDYIKNLYGDPKKDGKGVQEYHKKKYGDISEFGYTDFIPMFTAPKFNADEWVGLMYEAGARFGGICLVHHDGFCLWDSKYTRWDSKDKGPKRDIYGEIAKAVRKHDDMKLLATFHHGRTYGYADGFLDKKNITEDMRKNWDMFDPQFADFFRSDITGGTEEQFGTEWVGKITEVIDNYQPDAIWFDGLSGAMKNNHPSEQQVLDVLAYYYNTAEKNDQDVTVCNKHAGDFNFPHSFGMLCYENGREMKLDVQPWFLIDRAIGYPWSYVNNKTYRDGPDYHIRSLIDLVSRGGVFLLSLTPMGDGAISAREQEIMRGIGKWLKANGEAIYATRRWKTVGEGLMDLTDMSKSSSGKMRAGWNYRRDFTAKDIRFTRSKDGKTLYATALNWPEDGKLLIKTLSADNKISSDDKIKSVTMLASGDKLTFSRTSEGLEVIFPKTKPCEFAYALKIEVKGDLVIE